MTREPPSVLIGRGALPTSSTLLEAFDEAGGPVSVGAPVFTIAIALAAHHAKQWAAEDLSRNAVDNDAKAAAKNLIDQLNARRVELVAQIDDWIADEVPTNPRASLHTETLGSVVDRLAIAWVRCQQLVSSGLGEQRSGGVAQRQLAELASAYDDLLHDLVEGRRRLPAWRPLKRYGSRR